jgi:hypothetical protein
VRRTLCLKKEEQEIGLQLNNPSATSASAVRLAAVTLLPLRSRRVGPRLRASMAAAASCARPGLTPMLVHGPRAGGSPQTHRPSGCLE